jgi:hypothetical protein
MDSILNSVKKLLGIDQEEVHFDQEIILHINSALMGLNQIGVGEQCVIITSEYDKWDSIIGTKVNLEAIKLYIYLKVRLIFDPPTNAFVLDSIERQISQLEWRLNVQVEKFVPEVIVIDE